MLEPDHPIPGLGGLTVGNFWSWVYSDILDNRNRSVFAEFLVAAALGVIDQPRVEWNAFDLEYRARKIEVKASAYLQSWQQNGLSRIKFDIAKKQGWNAATNTYADEAERTSDCYVFCVYTETDPTQANVLVIQKWEFYVVAAAQLDSELGDQKSISLTPLKSMCTPVGFQNLKSRVDAVLSLP